jgi:hypothetical protein
MLIRPSLPGSVHPKARPAAVHGPQEEPPELYGALFQQETDGTVRVLRYSGETSPTSPPDIGEDAAGDGQVFLSVNGIDQDWVSHRQQITDWYHGGFAISGAHLDRPIIGIHEGDRKGAADVLRILKNTLILKTFQGGMGSLETIREAAYANDPSVKTIHDQVRQSLAVGRQVTLMAHSGGGSQVALALTLLSEEGGEWQQAISDRVRVMGTAATTTRQDLRRAGVEEDNIFLTYSKRDSVPGFYTTPTSMTRPFSILRAAGRGLFLRLRETLKPGPWHEGHYIFEHNMTERGSRIDAFLQGGGGGTYRIP